MKILKIFLAGTIFFLASSSNILFAEDEQLKSKEELYIDSLFSQVWILMQTNKYFETIELIEEIKTTEIKYNIPEEKKRDTEGLLGLLLIQHYAYDLAVEQYIKAIDVAKARKDTFAVGANYANFAHLHVLKDDLEAYDKYVEDAIRWNKYKDKNKYHLLETKVMALFKRGKYDEIISLMEVTLKELKKNGSKKSLNLNNEKMHETITKRLTITFEFYLAYSLMEKEEKIDKAYAILSKLDNTEIEKILWLSPRVYRHKYLISHYLGIYHNKFSLDRDSVSFYVKKADSLMIATNNMYHSKLRSDTQKLSEASKNQLELKQLKLDEQKRISSQKAFNRVLIIGILIFSLFVLTYFVYQEKKSKNNLASINEKLVEKENKLRGLVVVLQNKNKILESQVKKKLLLISNYEQQNNEIINFVKQKKVPKNMAYSNEILKLLKKNMGSDVIESTDFELLELHQSFYTELSKRYPRLTGNNLKLCSLLKMNLSTKEISAILNVSSDSIKVARSRLRKMMNLPARANSLPAFLNTIEEDVDIFIT